MPDDGLECESWPVEAMWLAQFWALALSSPSTASGPKPAEARALCRSDSIRLDSAPPAVAGAADSTVAAAPASASPAAEMVAKARREKSLGICVLAWGEDWARRTPGTIAQGHPNETRCVGRLIC